MKWHNGFPAYVFMMIYKDGIRYHMLEQGEFYLEYGDIEYTITAPSDLIVVGSGELLNPQDCYTADQQKKWDEAKNSDKTVIIRGEKEIKDSMLQDRISQTVPGNLKFRMQEMLPGVHQKLLYLMQQKLIYQVGKNQWPSALILLKV